MCSNGEACKLQDQDPKQVVEEVIVDIVEVVMEPTEEDENDIFASEYWNQTDAFKHIGTRKTQLQHYVENGASEDVLKLVALDSKQFGSTEKIICEILKLGPRTSTQNDATFNGKKIEIKCARYWNGTDDCRWQHLEPDHDYEYVLFGLLDYHRLKLWGIHKSVLMGELREKRIVTNQGKQGWWTCKSKILPYLTPITSINALRKFIV